MNWESIIWTLFAIANGLLGFFGGVRLIREEAIKYGVAKWTINPATGKRTFQWLGPLSTDKP